MNVGAIELHDLDATTTEPSSRLQCLVKYRHWLGLIWLIPIGLAFLLPSIARNPYFVASSVVVCAQVAVIMAPRVLWFQFEDRVTWEDIQHDRGAKHFLLIVSDLVTVGGCAICVTVLVSRYHAGDLLAMATVAEIGSTLFLVKQAQRLIGRPALSYGRHRARLRQTRLAQDLQARPQFSHTGDLLWEVGRRAHVFP